MVFILDFLAHTVTLSMAPERGTCDVCSLEDWVFRVSQVAAYLELLVSEGLAVVLPNRPPLTLLPACLEAPWSKLKCLLDLPTLMFLAPQVWHSNVPLKSSSQKHCD